MIQLDSKSLKLMIASASNQILNNVEKVNDMNVFPVPDGDTGTNMSMTFSAAAKICDKITPEFPLAFLRADFERTPNTSTGDFYYPNQQRF